MMIEQVWLLKILLSHLLTDFLLQPRSWVEERKQKHFKSFKLYLHGLITGGTVLLLLGWNYWLTALVIGITHTLIDGWKSYQKDTVFYFLADQCVHLMVILFCWYFTFLEWSHISAMVAQLNAKDNFWMLTTAIVFLTTPAGILIGQLTKGWREKISHPESLANAGKWIGIIERMIVLIFVLLGQYAAISLLIAAKGIIRFSEKDRPEVKTEYLVIGTLMSIGIAVSTGVVLKQWLQ